MAFQLSPGVTISEIDLTTVIPSGATSIGAFAGPFAWGPINEIITVSSELQLAKSFGNPSSSNYENWFSAANFLAYSSNLKVVRAVNISTTRNASANGGNNVVLIKNEEDWEDNHSSGNSAFGIAFARYAGVVGNTLEVSFSDANTHSTWEYASLFTSSPGTSTYVSNKGGSFDELHAIVIDEDGLFSGTRGTILEKFPFMSKASDAKDDSGNSNFYKNVIEAQSEYIHWMDHPSTGAGTALAILFSCCVP